MIAAIVALAAAGCTTAGERGGAFAAPVRIFVAPVEAAPSSGARAEDGAALRSGIARRLRRVKGVHLADASEVATHVLAVRVERIDPGEGLLRFIVGFGVGPAELRAAASVRDASGVEAIGLDFERTYPAVIWREPSLRRRLADDAASAVTRLVRERAAIAPRKE